MLQPNDDDGERVPRNDAAPVTYDATKRGARAWVCRVGVEEKMKKANGYGN